VGELVGVDDRVDAVDLTAGDVERDPGDQPLSCVEIERTVAVRTTDKSRRA
jgi:hypothetical protein